MGLGGSYKHPTMELNKGVYMPQPRTTPKLHFQEITCKCHNDRSHYCVMTVKHPSQNDLSRYFFIIYKFPTTLTERPGAGGN